jgi:RimJ/RimL family protein N-acetyltransferase
VILRAWSEDDAEVYAAAVHDPEIQRWTREGHVTAQQVRDAVRRVGHEPGRFCIADDDGRAIGNAGWKVLDDEPGTVEGYYWVAADARGRGVASTALRELFDRAVEAGATTVRLVIRIGNEASNRTAERAGFIRTGATDDSIVFERTS